jgi:hypothetical protein
MAYASSRSRIVGIVSGSLYEWTGAAWVLLASGVLPTVGPIPLAPNEWAAAFDEWRQVLVATFMTAPGTLYEWNGTSVTTSTVTGGPTAREEAAMTFDPVRGMTVLAGGTAVNANGTGGLVGLADAWGWDGQQWRELSPTPPAAPVAMAYDLARLRLVASGAAIRGFGATGTWQVPGTWERDAIGWHRMATAFSPGPGRMVFDSVLGQVVMVEDNSNSIAPRSWNGTTWSPTVLVVCPPPRSQFALTFDTVQGQVVLFGGGNGSALFNDTWVWNRQAWAQAQPASNPSPRAQTALAFDQTRGRAVLFGGRTAVGAVDDTWEWDGLNQSWTQQPVAAPPPARVAHAMTWDPLHGGVTMTGGVLPMVIGGAPVNLRLPLELWSWNGSTWTNAPINQLRRSEPAMEFDFARGRLVVQGGYDADSLLGDPVSTSDTVELAAGSPNVGIGLPANCAAGPQPLLQAESLPFLGNALFALTLTGGSPNALAALGFGLPLPEAFAPVFGTGCRLLLSAPATVVFRPTNPGGAARWPLPVPASPALRGTLLFAQAAAIDGAGQVSTTRSLFVTISD